MIEADATARVGLTHLAPSPSSPRMLSTSSDEDDDAAADGGGKRSKTPHATPGKTNISLLCVSPVLCLRVLLVVGLPSLYVFLFFLVFCGLSLTLCPLSLLLVSRITEMGRFGGNGLEMKYPHPIVASPSLGAFRKGRPLLSL